MAPRARRCVILLALAVASSQDAVDWLSLTDDIERSSLLTVLVRPPSPLPRATRERVRATSGWTWRVQCMARVPERGEPTASPRRRDSIFCADAGQRK